VRLAGAAAFSAYMKQHDHKNAKSLYARRLAYCVTKKREAFYDKYCHTKTATLLHYTLHVYKKLGTEFSPNYN